MCEAGREEGNSFFKTSSTGSTVNHDGYIRKYIYQGVHIYDGYIMMVISGSTYIYMIVISGGTYIYDGYIGEYGD